MNDHLKEIAAQLTRDLNLDLPPVQVSYLDAPPAGVPEHPGGVPSVCTFFAQGTEKAFYAGLPKHEDCEIGAFVLGIPPEGAGGQRLMGTIGTMQKEGYLNPGEEAHVPHNATPPNFVAYGPLGSLPMPPTSVLLFAHPDSVMLAVETAGAGPGAQAVPMNGRPMCAIMPIMNHGAPVAISLGCTGSRIYTEMGNDRMVVGIRGDHLDQFAKKLSGIVHANEWVRTEDLRRKQESSHPFHRSGP
ncbi:MAG: DUF169 domain-containing protein [Thermoplasmata archaeon]|nr:DUF169 domain-containing protein [Thermoplasmata archaeon]